MKRSIAGWLLLLQAAAAAAQRQGHHQKHARGLYSQDAGFTRTGPRNSDTYSGASDDTIPLGSASLHQGGQAGPNSIAEPPSSFLDSGVVGPDSTTNGDRFSFNNGPSASDVPVPTAAPGVSGTFFGRPSLGVSGNGFGQLGGGAVSDSPSTTPTGAPSDSPSQTPSLAPSGAPSDAPSLAPSTAPSGAPSDAPSLAPSLAPSGAPSDQPSLSPSGAPSAGLGIFNPNFFHGNGGSSDAPSAVPSAVPSDAPSYVPSDVPSLSPSISPSSNFIQEGASQSDFPSIVPSQAPSDAPSLVPSDAPSMAPSDAPSVVPSSVPSSVPSDAPSLAPSSVPSDAPSLAPSRAPSDLPSLSPSQAPSSYFAALGSGAPSLIPLQSSDYPSLVPSTVPSDAPSVVPSSAPSGATSDAPSQAPSLLGAVVSEQPSGAPGFQIEGDFALDTFYSCDGTVNVDDTDTAELNINYEYTLQLDENQTDETTDIDGLVRSIEEKTLTAAMDNTCPSTQGRRRLQQTTMAASAQPEDYPSKSCGTYCYNMQGAMVYRLGADNATAAASVYCAALEAIYQLFESGDLAASLPAYVETASFTVTAGSSICNITSGTGGDGGTSSGASSTAKESTTSETFVAIGAFVAAGAFLAIGGIVLSLARQGKGEDSDNVKVVALQTQSTDEESGNKEHHNAGKGSDTNSEGLLRNWEGHDTTIHTKNSSNRSDGWDPIATLGFSEIDLDETSTHDDYCLQEEDMTA